MIHVAGTNGKGKHLRFFFDFHSAGGRLFLRTVHLPHLVEINERFQINEENIDNETFLQAFLQVKSFRTSWLRKETIIPPILRCCFSWEW